MAKASNTDISKAFYPRIKRSNPRWPKMKGDAYERELAAYFRSELGLNVFRAPLSGGGNHKSSGHPTPTVPVRGIDGFTYGERKNNAVKSVAGGADLMGLPGLFVEAKRVERVNVREALHQATRNCSLLGSIEAPIVITRRNFESTSKSLVVLHLDDFVELYRHYLATLGIKEPKSNAPVPPPGDQQP